ncbi:unnamed protein product [Cuscuta epithymum]|uniref:C2H2-type domain-containing protein n=1 Tax=Cuscuta epithymum TaxID=186058 RepID=A0AAV0CYH1_9ASTE|nr:unnamed protein product [Cuscuta epithymum]
MKNFKYPVPEHPSSSFFLPPDHPISDLGHSQRELEKKRIREEIIAQEDAKRRILEAEVRMELRMEREASMLRGDPKVSSSEEFVKRSAEPRGALPDERSLQDIIVKLVDERLALLISGNVRAAKQDLNVPKSPEEVDRLILKPKTDDVDVSEGLKQEVAINSELFDKKKIKQDWSCDLCQITATSKASLNDHFQGKKHKAKEAPGKNFSIGLSLNSPKLDMPKESSMVVITDEKSAASGQTQEKTEVKKRKNYKFWCENCGTGTFSSKVMEDHKTGKKHLSKVEKDSAGI